MFEDIFDFCDVNFTTHYRRTHKARKFQTKTALKKERLPLFGRTLQKNSFSGKWLHRKKTSLQLMSMSSADELLNGKTVFGCEINTKEDPILTDEICVQWDIN